MRTRKSLILSLACGSLLCAAPAQAVTVNGSAHTDGGIKGPEYSVFDLAITSEPGEASDLTVTAVPQGNTVRVAVSDAAAPVTAAGLCTTASPTAVVCDGPSALGRFTADLGDGNDRFRLTTGATAVSAAWGAAVSAGPGDDEVNGGAGNDMLDGGGGRDVLRGGGGSDGFDDGDRTGSPDSDVIDGGAGSGYVTYQRRTAAVVIDLPAGRGGETGENDKLIAIESGVGGPGADTLTGTDAGNSLMGGPGGPDVVVGAGGDDDITVFGGRADAGAGNDTVECAKACVAQGGDGDDDVHGSDEDDQVDAGAGRDELNGFDGDDELSGGAGNDMFDGGGGRDRVTGGAGNDRIVDSSQRDRLAGGAGRDVIFAADRRADTVICGTGRDRLIGDRREQASGCERREVGLHVRFTLGRKERLTGGREFTVAMQCPQLALDRCRGWLEARVGNVLVGRSHYRGTGLIFSDIRLRRVGRALLARGGKVTVTARGGDGTGGTHRIRRVYRLRR